MSIWDKVRKGVGQVAAEVSTAAEGLRVQTEIGNAQADLERVYAEAGKRAKQLWREGKIVDADLDMLLRHTNELEEQIDELRKKSLGMEE